MFFWKENLWKRYKLSKYFCCRDTIQNSGRERWGASGCFQPLRIDSPFYSMIEQTHAGLSLNFLLAPKLDVETSESKLDDYVRPKKKVL